MNLSSLAIASIIFSPFAKPRIADKRTPSLTQHNRYLNVSISKNMFFFLFGNSKQPNEASVKKSFSDLQLIGKPTLKIHGNASERF